MAGRGANPVGREFDLDDYLHGPSPGARTHTYTHTLKDGIIPCSNIEPILVLKGLFCF